MKTLVALVMLFPLSLGAARGAESSEEGASKVAAELEKAKKRVTETTYQLRYKFAKGEEIRSRVVHLGTTETKIQGNTQTSKSRSVSTKLWKIIGVDPQGQITLVHSIEDLEMWQHVSTGTPIIRSL